MGIAALRRLLLAAFVGLVIATCALVAVVSLGDGGESGEQRVLGPRIGDHWHAALSVVVCVVKAENLPEFESPTGIHTHGDGIIHMHPFTASGEVAGASLERFLSYGGFDVILSLDSGQGFLETAPSSESCVSEKAELRILRADSGIHPLGGGEGASFSDAIAVCDGLDESDFEEVDADYVPLDGDCIRIVFGP